MILVSKRHHPSPLLALLVALVAACLLAPSAMAAETMRLEDPITDNYKASYNADPNAPENRTWLGMRRILAAGTTWAPIVPSVIEVSGDSIDLSSADGRTGTLQLRTSAGPLAAPLIRTDPATATSGGRWGPLATVTDRAALERSAGVLSLTLLVDGVTLATGVVEYRYDAALATAPATSLEYNGPGGRWYVGGIATRTNEEAPPTITPILTATPSALSLPRPRIVQLLLPQRTSTRTISMRVRARAADSTSKITHVRTRIDARRWGRWVRVRASYSVVLPAGLATHTVRVQVRDAAGRASPIAARRVICTCS